MKIHVFQPSNLTKQASGYVLHTLSTNAFVATNLRPIRTNAPQKDRPNQLRYPFITTT